jgi:hypothetical protein
MMRRLGLGRCFSMRALCWCLLAGSLPLRRHGRLEQMSQRNEPEPVDPTAPGAPLCFLSAVPFTTYGRAFLLGPTLTGVSRVPPRLAAIQDEFECSICNRWTKYNFCRHLIDPENRLYLLLTKAKGWRHSKAMQALDAYAKFLTLKGPRGGLRRRAPLAHRHHRRGDLMSRLPRITSSHSDL